MSQKSGTMKESKTIVHDDKPAHFGEQKIDVENSYDSFLQNKSVVKQMIHGNISETSPIKVDQSITPLESHNQSKMGSLKQNPSSNLIRPIDASLHKTISQDNYDDDEGFEESTSPLPQMIQRKDIDLNKPRETKSAAPKTKDKPSYYEQ